MYQAIQTKTLAGSYTAFTFTNGGRAFFVKNLTTGDIYATFDTGTPDDKESFLIASGYAQECVAPVAGGKVKTIYVKGTGDVRVEQEDGWEE